jgi:hypothetical protein
MAITQIPTSMGMQPQQVLSALIFLKNEGEKRITKRGDSLAKMNILCNSARRTMLKVHKRENF